jgi:putative (di)nucleoside polyphosphate hydrolase
MSSIIMLKFRPNVAAIVRRANGDILIAERTDVANAWQFPQGGIDRGETDEQALARELVEEISLRPKDYQVLENRGPYSYTFNNGRKKRGYDGQIQQYFLVELTGPESGIDVNTEHREFKSIRWIRPADFQLSWLPPMKREVYRAVLRDFFNVLL